MNFQSDNSQVFFEALCCLDPSSLASIGGPAVSKLTKFCRDSSLGIYLVSFMDRNEVALFLTKQRLIPKTGYCCNSDHLGLRKFASVEILVTNTVKRLMPKSDSKFIEKFSLLLDSEAVYCRQVSLSHVLFFRKHQEGSVEFWYEKLEIDPKPANSKNLKNSGLFHGFDQKRENTAKIASLLSSRTTFVTKGLPLDASAMTPCQINPPNILCSLWNQPPLVVKYFQGKALEGNKEEGECRRAIVTLDSPLYHCESYFIQGFGTIIIPPEIEELTKKEEISEKEWTTEKDKNSSKNHTCESTPEQPRGYASKISDQDSDDSEIQEELDPNSKAIAQTMALISSGHKYSADDNCVHMALFRKLKRQLAPGRRFTLF